MKKMVYFTRSEIIEGYSDLFNSGRNKLYTSEYEVIPYVYFKKYKQKLTGKWDFKVNRLTDMLEVYIY